MSDAEWVILAPFPPLPSRYGRRRKWEIREIINAIFYVLRGGITWSLLPKEFPPRPKTYRWFTRLHDDGTWETINHHLVTLDRERVAREASPTAAVIDSQSVKMTKSSGIRGYDKGEAIKGRKLHVMADADARALKLHAHSADIQDRDGAGPLPLRVASELAVCRPELRRWRLRRSPRGQRQPDPHQGCAKIR